MTPLSTICLETHRPSINVNILVHLDALTSWFFHLHISLPTSTFHLFFSLLTSLHLSSLESPTLHHQHLLGPYPLHSFLSIMTPSLVYSLPLFHFFGHVAPYDASTFWPLHISTKKKKKQKTKDKRPKKELIPTHILRRWPSNQPHGTSYPQRARFLIQSSTSSTCQDGFPLPGLPSSRRHHLVALQSETNRYELLH